MKSVVFVWSRIAPWSCACFLTRKIFKVKRSSRQKDQLPQVHAKLYLDNNTTLSSWLGTEQKAVLFVHGWSGNGEQFAELFHQFRSNGYSIYLVQPKGHGSCFSRTSNPGDFIRSIGTSLKYIDKPIVATVAHSIGAGAVLHVASKRKLLGKIVSISSPRDFNNFLFEFCRKLSVSKKSKQLFCAFAELEIKIGRTELQIDNCVRNLSNPTLFIHDEEDSLLPLHNAISLHKNLAGSELYITKGLGHQGLLKSKPVLDKIFNFCNEDY